MPNLNYRRGRQAEYKMQRMLEDLHYIVFRTSGSHGIADLIAVKPRIDVGEADLYPEVRFIQVKSSNKTKKMKCVDKFIKYLKIEFWKFPTKDEKWQKKYSKKAKKLKHLTKNNL